MSLRPRSIDRTLGVTAAAGFSAAGVACGIKPSGGLDLALVVGRPGTIAAGSFTTNQVVAAPVVWSHRRLAASADARVVVINSGNANACTGPAGDEAVLASVRRAAAELGCEPEQVLACSTGVIGVPLEVAKLTDGIAKAARDLGPDGGLAAAEAIRTTDTVSKQAGVVVDGITVGGMAKGAAMLAPELALAAPPGAARPHAAPPDARFPHAGPPSAGLPHATMIAMLTTDALAEPRVLRGVLAEACESSFNRVTVDGAQSTNDTVLLLASGSSGVRPHADELGEAVGAVCHDLAGQMLADAEGGTKVFSVQVGGAGTVEAAIAVARRVADSPLVKTAVYGGDPNWGRILQAAGAAGVPFDPARVRLEVRGAPGAAGIERAAEPAGPAGPGGPGEQAHEATWQDPPERVVLVRDGAPTGADAGEAFRAKEIEVRLHLGGTGPWGSVRSADLTPEYVRFNSEYTT